MVRKTLLVLYFDKVDFTGDFDVQYNNERNVCINFKQKSQKKKKKCASTKGDKNISNTYQTILIFDRSLKYLSLLWYYPSAFQNYPRETSCTREIEIISQSFRFGFYFENRSVLLVQTIALHMISIQTYVPTNPLRQLCGL